MEVSSGIQIFDKNGDITIDITTRLTRLFGVKRGIIGSGYQDFVIKDDNIKKDYAWAMVVQDPCDFESYVPHTYLRTLHSTISIEIQDGMITLKRTDKSRDGSPVHAEVYYGGC